MRKIYFLLFLSLCSVAWGQYVTFTEAIYTGNLSRINEILEDPFFHYGWERWDNGFLIFTQTELRLLRNTIYAKYGYKFNTPDMQRHFSQFIWYNGTKTNIEAELTDIERQYVSIIQRIEANYPSASNEVIGYWLDLPDGDWWEINPRLYCYQEKNKRDLIIYPNGTFYLLYKQIEAVKAGTLVRTFVYIGVWSFRNNEFCVSYLYENIREAGTQPPIINFENNLNIHDNNGYLECRFLVNEIPLKRVDTDPNVRYDKLW
jgi:hypothetical protein